MGTETPVPMGSVNVQGILALKVVIGVCVSRQCGSLARHKKRLLPAHGVAELEIFNLGLHRLLRRRKKGVREELMWGGMCKGSGMRDMRHKIERHERQKD
jgi:hypothetical protein